MDTMAAFLLAEVANTLGCKHKVFDWDKAATTIRESGCKNALAGLKQDWPRTGGLILIDGQPDLDSYTFLASNWATPVLVLDNNEEHECWCYMDDCPFDSETKWPQSAINTLYGVNNQ
jgi:hypothetical protein